MSDDKSDQEREAEAARVFAGPDPRVVLEAENARLRAELAARGPLAKPALPVSSHPLASAGRDAAGPARGIASPVKGTGLANAFARSTTRLGR